MKLALGTVQFGLNYGVANSSGQVSNEDAVDIMRHALQAGIDTLDTAIDYGESESVIGKIGAQLWKVVTKLPAVPEGCVDVTKWVKSQVQGSLKRMAIDSLHGLLLHRPCQLLEGNGAELFTAIQSLKADGLVGKVGISVYSPAELDALFNVYTFDLVQAPLNILDRGLVESGWAEKLYQAGVEVHTRSAFLQGLLLMPSQERPTVFNRWTEIWKEWDRWLLLSDLTPLQACLGYVNSIPSVNRMVVGVDSVDHLKQIILADDKKIKNLPTFSEFKDSRIINPSSWKNLKV